MAKARRKKVAARQNASRSRGRGKFWLLAIDPFAELDFAPVLRFLDSFLDRLNVRLQAAYVLAPASFNWTGEFSGPWLKKYQPLAEQKLAEMLPLDRIQPAVLSVKHAGLRASVQRLIQFAKRLDAECIVISTHARTGLDRLVLGSFAESLILSSPIPVLAINPNHPIPTDLHRILIPTDLSKEGERAVMLNADFAKRLSAEIVLYHRQTNPLDPIVQQGVYTLGGGWVSVQNFLASETKANEEALNRLETALVRRGVNAKWILDTTSVGIVLGILDAAVKESVQLISLVTRSGPLSSLVLGSVARGLIREAKVPVLIRRT